MPKLWNETIEAHRRTVREAVLDAAAALTAEHGPASLTMSQIAVRAGIGRATLYKYFPDVEAVLAARRQREAERLLARLTGARDRAAGRTGPGGRLQAVLLAYALAAHEQRGAGVLPDHGSPSPDPQQPVLELLRELLAQAADAGAVRADIGADELAAYCLHALAAAGAARSEAAVHRLLALTLSALRPEASPAAP
ncbi:helix-turn-helix transcriptional regulator [Streptacidiphilus sp. PB12-B1b]|uniref:TetR/AcrR family transcriptional regulator n=1 Tax=Streptacidiphilus sp. PB12-B1b TaxID=2705012 RepID=UPI0015F83240|nr:helix-turn-helix domain-containing protein [Streptacidiphilus sp. PB12-B1b]QMU77685.1 helix-turn-helix transcriptional regulator [Streptacidiphilus sp. PB12-B1b]